MNLATLHEHEPDEDRHHEAPSARFSRARFSRQGRVWRVTRIAGACLIMWCVGAWSAAKLLSVRAELPQQQQQADAVVVLAGSSVYIERAAWGARLFHEQRATRILVTNDNAQGGWSSEQQRNPYFVERAMAELRIRGVPIENIEIVGLPRDAREIGTYREAQSVRDYAVQLNLQSLLIVTSDYHSRRAWWTFRRVFAGSGINIGIDPAPTGEQTPSPLVWWLSRRGWQFVAGEYVKLVYYQVRYSSLTTRERPAPANLHGNRTVPQN